MCLWRRNKLFVETCRFGYIAITPRQLGVRGAATSSGQKRTYSPRPPLVPAPTSPLQRRYTSCTFYTLYDLFYIRLDALYLREILQLPLYKTGYNVITRRRENGISCWCSMFVVSRHKPLYYCTFCVRLKPYTLIRHI